MRRRCAPTARGFTLLEMLVTLVLFATVSALIWQALASVARVEQRLGDTALFSTDEALRREWVRQALAGVMTGTRGDPLQPRGDGRVFEAISTAPPWPGSWGPQGMRLRLRQEGGQTVLLAQPLAVASGGGVTRLGEDSLWDATASGQTQDWPLLSWEGAGQWLYLDESGRWLQQWPPALGTPALDGQVALPPLRVPKAIALLGVPGGALLVAPQAGDNPMLDQRELREEP